MAYSTKKSTPDMVGITPTVIYIAALALAVMTLTSAMAETVTIKNSLPTMKITSGKKNSFILLKSTFARKLTYPASVLKQRFLISDARTTAAEKVLLTTGVNSEDIDGTQFDDGHLTYILNKVQLCMYTLMIFFSGAIILSCIFELWYYIFWRLRRQKPFDVENENIPLQLVSMKQENCTAV